MGQPAAAPASRTWQQKLRRGLVTAAVIYLGLLIVILAMESWFIFKPMTAAQSWQPAPNESFQDVTLTSAPGDKIHAWWLPRSGASGAILYSHGNAGNLSHRGPGVKRWSEMLNCSVLIYDYPGYGKSTGKPTEPSCLAAADAAWEWLTGEQKIEPDSVVLVGASLGGALATDLAHRHPHRALIMLKAFTSVPDMAQHIFPWLPARYFVRTRFDNLAKIPECRRPTFFLHAKKDTLIPLRHAERLYAAAPGPKELFIQETGDHNSALPAEFFIRLKAFLAKHAPGK